MEKRSITIINITASRSTTATLSPHCVSWIKQGQKSPVALIDAIEILPNLDPRVLLDEVEPASTGPGPISVLQSTGLEILPLQWNRTTPNAKRGFATPVEFFRSPFPYSVRVAARF